MFLTLDVTETYVNVKIKADYRSFVELSPFVMVLLWVKPSGVLEWRPTFLFRYQRHQGK